MLICALKDDIAFVCADSLLTKVIAHAPTYEEALRKLDRALNEFFVRGIKTNIGFVVNVLRHPEFAQVRPTSMPAQAFLT